MIVASVVTLSIALVMYLYVFRIGLEGKGGQDLQKMSTDQTSINSASAPYRSSRNFTSYRHRPQNTFVRLNQKLRHDICNCICADNEYKKTLERNDECYGQYALKDKSDKRYDHRSNGKDLSSCIDNNYKA